MDEGSRRKTGSGFGGEGRISTASMGMVDRREEVRVFMVSMQGATSVK